MLIESNTIVQEYCQRQTSIAGGHPLAKVLFKGVYSSIQINKSDKTNDLRLSTSTIRSRLKNSDQSAASAVRPLILFGHLEPRKPGRLDSFGLFAAGDSNHQRERPKFALDDQRGNQQKATAQCFFVVIIHLSQIVAKHYRCLDTTVCAFVCTDSSNASAKRLKAFKCPPQEKITKINSASLFHSAHKLGLRQKAPHGDPSQ
jgi:hypothetical protein